jgi:hypothetical protein
MLVIGCLHEPSHVHGCCLVGASNTLAFYALTAVCCVVGCSCSSALWPVAAPSFTRVAGHT